MNQLRKEVHEYIVASETLLSPVSIDEPLTVEELALVKYYATNLTEYCDKVASTTCVELGFR